MHSKLFLIICSFFYLNPCQAQDRIVIAAASDLRFALDSIITVYEKRSPGKIDVTYGSSGKLSEQIANGAPFHLFFSADIAYPELLKKKEFTASEIFHYATGRIVLWSKKFDTSVGLNALIHPGIRKIAIANPAHAPYGKRAVECLNASELYPKVESRLVLGDNITQTAQFISTGAADIGIIALSLALSPNLKKENPSYFLIPDHMHQPLTQGAVITKAGARNSLAISFFNYIKGEQASAILQHFGFNKP